jgi:hypothetical protein
MPVFLDGEHSPRPLQVNVAIAENGMPSRGLNQKS